MPASNDSPWFTRPLWIGLFVFLVLLVIKFDTLTEPPAWDAAMSVHPAALTLADNGFDYPDLLSMPTILEGGPNTHSLSTYTALVAIAYTLFTPTTAVTVLHLLTFAMAGLTGAALVRFSSHFLPRRLAVAASLVSLAMPLVLTQFGMIYLDAPVLTASTWAMVAAVERRWPAAAAFCMLATTVKPSGLITAVAVGLYWAFMVRSPKRSLLVMLPSLLVFGLQSQTAIVPSSPSVAVLRRLARYSWTYVSLVPDVILIILAGTAAALLLARRSSHQETDDLSGLMTAFLLVFIGMYATLWSVAYTTLPRYYIQILPLALITVFVAVFRQFGQKTVAALMIGLSLLFAVNFDGDLYRWRNVNYFSLIERSDGYDDLLTMQVAVASAICALPEEIPVIYTAAERYRINYPDLGYADCPNRRDAALWGQGFPPLDDLPSPIYLTYEVPLLGGRWLEHLVDVATSSPDWTVEVVDTIRDGAFEQEIYLLTRR